MTHKNSRTLFYLLRRIVGRFVPSFYILYVSGVLSDGITKESFKMSVIIVIAWLIFTFANDYIKSVKDKDIIKPKQRGIVAGVQGMLPWIIILLVATGIKIGIADMYEHLMFITGTQLGGNIFYGFEEYHKWEIKKSGNP